MRRCAFAKINLSLEVIGRRSDGFHEIISVIQLIALHDELSFELGPDLSLTSTDESLLRDDNLILRAARLLQQITGTPLAASISVKKRIPFPGGLGGGSSDAATTLLALVRLWRLHLPRGRLLEIAASLGSDVPFFLRGPTCLVRGRGEQLEQLRPPVKQAVVLVVPRIDMEKKTALLYSALRPSDYSDGKITVALAEKLRSGQKADPAGFVSSFERVALQLFPQVSLCRQAMLAAGAPSPRLSGAGPALFSMVDDENIARRICERLQAELQEIDVSIIQTSTIDHPEQITESSECEPSTW